MSILNTCLAAAWPHRHTVGVTIAWIAWTWFGSWLLFITPHGWMFPPVLLTVVAVWVLLFAFIFIIAYFSAS